MKIYVPFKLQDMVSTADVLFNDKMLGWFEKKIATLQSLKRKHLPPCVNLAWSAEPGTGNH